MANIHERAEVAAGMFAESMTDSRELRGELIKIVKDPKAGKLVKTLARMHAAIIFTDMVPLAIGEAAGAFVIPPAKMI